MLPLHCVRPKSTLALIGISLVLTTSELALAAPGDCMQIDAKATAGILGVPARAIANQGHTKMPPGNMDFLACTYIEVTPGPTARMLSYLIYTPIARTWPTNTAVFRAEISPESSPSHLTSVISRADGSARI